MIVKVKAINSKIGEKRSIMEEINITENQAKTALEKGYAKAEKVLNDRDKLDELLEDVEKKLKIIPKIGEMISHIPVLVSMVRSYIRKEYTKIPTGTIIAIISALLYFFMPVDLIADFLPGIGYIDDVAVIGFCLKFIDSDIKDYIVWRDNSKKYLCHNSI